MSIDNVLIAIFNAAFLVLLFCFPICEQLNSNKGINCQVQVYFCHDSSIWTLMKIFLYIYAVDPGLENPGKLIQKIFRNVGNVMLVDNVMLVIL